MGTFINIITAKTYITVFLEREFGHNFFFPENEMSIILAQESKSALINLLC